MLLFYLSLFQKRMEFFLKTLYLQCLNLFLETCLNLFILLPQILS